jgi:hypothetical protein
VASVSINTRPQAPNVAASENGSMSNQRRQPAT